MHRSGGKRSICERSRMLSPAGHSPGTPLLRCFSNPLLRFRCRFRSQPGSSRAKTFALPVVELPVVDLGNGYQEWGSTSSSSKRNLLFQNPDQPWLLLCGEVFTGISLRILHHVKPEINRSWLAGLASSKDSTMEGQQVSAENVILSVCQSQYLSVADKRK